MSQQGAALQTYSSELVKCIEDLKRKRAELQISIEHEESEKAILQSDIEKLSYRLNQINGNLSKKIAARSEFDRTIYETEEAFAKIVESSQVLLNMAHREAVSLDQAIGKKMLQSVPDDNEIQ